MTDEKIMEFPLTIEFWGDTATLYLGGYILCELRREYKWDPQLEPLPGKKKGDYRDETDEELAERTIQRLAITLRKLLDLSS